MPPDLISSLPDCVLGSIVSLLGTEEGARTAVLARRWRHVWLSSPLNFEEPPYSCQHIQIISQILHAHIGPARRVAFTRQMTSNVFPYDDWFRLPLFDALEELILYFGGSCIDIQRLPSSALRFASLRVLDIKYCIFPDVCSVAFPCLTHLSLYQVGDSGSMKISFRTLFPVVSGSRDIIPVSPVERFSAVRILALTMPKLNLKVVICYLRCFPFLEKLHIKMDEFERPWILRSVYSCRVS
ncbi:hypothetical protein QOZ80_2AG0142990 [Eleusine coracana subsp. coracana]|nr:hypothetical protein QOZ80_2AG0142990 [Eleusine coracana subsp. coracana]